MNTGLAAALWMDGNVAKHQDPLIFLYFLLNEFLLKYGKISIVGHKRLLLVSQVMRPIDWLFFVNRFGFNIVGILFLQVIDKIFFGI